MLKRSNWRRARGQAGDTIVEVMIVLAVLGMAIGISYSTANRSLLNARQAQEASLATEIVQAQVESLKALAGGNDIYANPDFCITNSGSALTVSPLTAAQASDPLGASFPASCQMGEANRYSIVITQPSAGTFNVKAYWNDVEGQGTDTATLNYRLPTVQPVVGGGGDVGGGGGGGGGGGTPPTLILTAANQKCGVPGGPLGSSEYSADLVVTGPPNASVVVTSNFTIVNFQVNTDYNLTLDSNGHAGHATQHIDNGGWYFKATWSATANGPSGSNASVQVCP